MIGRHSSPRVKQTKEKIIIIVSKSVICVAILNVESLESDVDRFAGHDEGSSG